MQIMNHQPTKKKLRLGNQTDLEQDRLSNLPETLIYHILSLLETKDAIQTCVLSKTWRYHWTNIHTLYFDFANFRRYESADTDHRVLFREFVLNVLIRRNPFNLHKLKFYCRGSIHFSLVRRVFNYANSHGLEHLETDIVTKFPARDLKTLKLGFGHGRDFSPNLFGFATLTNLHICGVKLPAKGDLFSGLLNLGNLSSIDCSVSIVVDFIISAPCLVNLTISDFGYIGKIMFRDSKLVISAPKLKLLNLSMEHQLVYPLVLSIHNCPTFDQVDIHIYPTHFWRKDYMRRQTLISDVIRMLEVLCHVNSLTISLDLFKVSV
ncbi:hypothetical protein LWI29_020811 [Acer saccharum]|uniref:F-box domain-containing protein n=1 Tax=Acer saccharum TaxID=4024 RepID=A0AA39VS75_ACESA|nr:hypothetical protein LWI29_020811 [Acer saccharum]